MGPNAARPPATLAVARRHDLRNDLAHATRAGSRPVRHRPVTAPTAACVGPHRRRASMRVLYCTDTYPPQINGVSIVTALSVAGLRRRGLGVRGRGATLPGGDPRRRGTMTAGAEPGAAEREPPQRGPARLSRAPARASRGRADGAPADPAASGPTWCTARRSSRIGRMGQRPPRRAGIPVGLLLSHRLRALRGSLRRCPGSGGR